MNDKTLLALNLSNYERNLILQAMLILRTKGCKLDILPAKPLILQKARNTRTGEKLETKYTVVGLK